MDDTWASRELPVLTAIATAFEINPNGTVSLADIERETEFTREELARAMAKLDVATPPFFDGTRIGELSYPVTVTSITERTLVATGHGRVLNLQLKV
jgi:hypothetical protein